MQRIYAKSSKAKDCRAVVMAYNAARGELNDQEEDQLNEDLFENAEQENEYYEEEHVRATEKWKEFAADEEEEDFTIAAPALVPKKPKPVIQKRALDHGDSEGGPSSRGRTKREARPFGNGDDDVFPSHQRRELLSAVTESRAHEKHPGLIPEAPSKQYAEAMPMHRAPLEPTRNEPIAGPPALPPPQQQAGKKWGSFVDNDDVW